MAPYWTSHRSVDNSILKMCFLIILLIFLSAAVCFRLEMCCVLFGRFMQQANLNRINFVVCLGTMMYVKWIYYGNLFVV